MISARIELHRAQLSGYEQNGITLHGEASEFFGVVEHIKELGQHHIKRPTAHV